MKNSTLTFTLQQAGLINGTGAIAQLSSQCWTDANGNVVGAPNPPVLPNMAANYGSGTVPGGIYYVVYTFLTASGQSAPSPENRIQLTGTGSIVIQPPASIPAGVTGINVYIGTASGQETAQGTQAVNAVFTQSTPLASGTAPPTSNTSICSIAFNDTIIPYQGYNVSLTSANGNAYPGWPQSWQLNGGPAGTINVSSGAPLWNGTVIYPMPILSQPLNHGPQSISGPLDFGGYNVTNMGTATAGVLNGVVNANLQAGSDIGAKVNASLLLCGYQCTVYIPAGSYSYSTTMSIPLNQFGGFSLLLDSGAILSYTGTGDAIQFPVAGAGPTEGACRISGGALFGNASAKSGIHLLPTNTCFISNVTIASFSAGKGIWVDGANAVYIHDNFIFGNVDGVFLTNTFCNGAVCNDLGTGSPFTPNAVMISHNTIVSNSGWGVHIFDAQTGSNTGALDDVISDNDLELNAAGGVSVGRSHGLNVHGNYFEGEPIGVQLGIAGGGDSNHFFASMGAVLRDNYFTVQTGNYQFNLLDTLDTVIEGNTQLIDTENSTNCFVNSLANSGANVGEAGTYIGKNHYELGSGGNVACIGGSGVSNLVGAGSYAITNTNYLLGVVNENFQIVSAGTSETVAVSGRVVAGSPCEVQPFNALAVTSSPNISPSFFIATGTNTGVLYHPANTNGLRVNILCAPGPLN